MDDDSLPASSADTIPLVSDEPSDAELDRLLANVPAGWSRHTIGKQSWGVSRVEHADGRSTTLTAEQLGSPVKFSANVWHTSRGLVLRPCEVPADVVINFLEKLPSVE